MKSIQTTAQATANAAADKTTYTKAKKTANAAANATAQEAVQKTTVKSGLQPSIKSEQKQNCKSTSEAAFQPSAGVVIASATANAETSITAGAAVETDDKLNANAAANAAADKTAHTKAKKTANATAQEAVQKTTVKSGLQPSIKSEQKPNCKPTSEAAFQPSAGAVTANATANAAADKTAHTKAKKTANAETGITAQATANAAADKTTLTKTKKTANAAANATAGAADGADTSISTSSSTSTSASSSANTPLSAGARLFLAVYRALFLCVQCLALLPSVVCLRFSRRVRGGFFNYLGFVPKIKHSSRLFWVHAVSVGESMAALGFCRELKKRFPEVKLVLSTTHPDVTANMQKKGIFEAVFYFPLDTVLAMTKAFNRLKPDAVFVCETDFWPEFSYQCKKRGIQLFLINGRISYKIRNFYAAVQPLCELVFGSYTRLFVQSAADAQSLYALNTSKARVCLAGNIKADLTLNAQQPSLSAVKAWLANRKCLVYGSLHPEEFNLILPTLKNIVSKNTAVVIAPRKPSDADAWRVQIQKQGFSVCLKSEGLAKSDIMLLNTMGELSALYKLASAAFVGGSLKTDVGGHNPLEVIAQGAPVLMGDRRRNFEDLTAQLLANNAMIQCKTEQDIINGFNKILSEPKLATEMTAAAALVLNANRGALNRIIKSVAASLNSAL